MTDPGEEYRRSLRLTQAISRLISGAAPRIDLTEEQLRRAAESYSPEEREILRRAGWLGEDMEVFLVIDRFLSSCGAQERASDAWLRQVYSAARKLTPDMLTRDPYLSAVRVPEAVLGRFRLHNMTYERGELLQYDMPCLSAPVVTPKLGFFTAPVSFPAVYEGNMPWVSVCPSEINSMGPDVEKARGRVLVLGLGLGWYPFMISLRQEVREIVIVERQEEILRLFRDHLLPQFPKKEKLRLVKADAFDYLPRVAPGEFDFCYADIWESQVDGAECCRRIFPHERRLAGTEFAYWIGDAIRWQLERDEE